MGRTCEKQRFLARRTLSQRFQREVKSEWLCGAREYSMISTIVKLLSAQMICIANQLACVSRCLPQQVLSLLWLSLLLSKYRQASERQELAHDFRCHLVHCPELEVADFDFKFPFVCGLGTGVRVALSLALIIRCLWSSRVELVTLRVRGVHLKSLQDVGTEKPDVTDRVCPVS